MLGSAWTKVTAAGLAERNDARHASHSNEPNRPQPAQDGGSSTSISAMAQDAAPVLTRPLRGPYWRLPGQASGRELLRGPPSVRSGRQLLQSQLVAHLGPRPAEGASRQLE